MPPTYEGENAPYKTEMIDPEHVIITIKWTGKKVRVKVPRDADIYIDIKHSTLRAKVRVTGSDLTKLIAPLFAYASSSLDAIALNSVKRRQPVDSRSSVLSKRCRFKRPETVVDLLAISDVQTQHAEPLAPANNPDADVAGMTDEEATPLESPSCKGIGVADRTAIQATSQAGRRGRAGVLDNYKLQGPPPHPSHGVLCVQTVECVFLLSFVLCCSFYI